LFKECTLVDFRTSNLPFSQNIEARWSKCEVENKRRESGAFK